MPFTQSKMPKRGLSFAQHYVADADMNGTRAAIAAGYAPKSAAAAAVCMLKNPFVLAEIRRLEDERAECLAIHSDDVLREWQAIAFADPLEVVRVERQCCRYCWGEGNLYQWRDRELIEAQLAAEESGKAMPDDRGGGGFDSRRAPNPLCSECDGLGHDKLIIEDMAKLKPAARKLIAGIKQTKYGIEITLRSQDHSLDMIAKHLGMLNEKIELDVTENLADLIQKARARVKAAGR